MVNNHSNKDKLINPKDHTILIVEDNPINLKIIQHVLLQAGYHILTAMRGSEAIEAALNHLPDLVLLDVILPDIDGYHVCHLLKESRTTTDIPIIFMTSLTDSDSIVQAFELGAVDYVTKPFKTEEVLARISTHLTLRNLQQGLQHEIRERELLIGDLEAFAHMVAHDLKNPIGHVIGFADILKQNRTQITDDEVDDMLQLLTQSAYKMRDIIDGLLLLARVRLENVEVKPVVMKPVIDEVIKQLAPMISEHNAQIEMPDEWPLVIGYAPWIEEVWVNYVSNGLKYGGTPPSLELGAIELESADSAKSAIKFWVRDNGAGLSIQQQEKLYQPFTRMHKTKMAGHGLGLSIVKRIVNKLGGEVGVESCPGEGSLFYFTLPLPSPQPSPEGRGS